MNLKARIVSLALVIVFSMFLSESIHSQGIFKNQPRTTEESTTNNFGGGGLFRDGWDDPPTDQPPGWEDTPVGEGLAILSLLSGGYLMFKKRKTKK